MIFDCAIIGGGPAGLNAALVLGRARREVLLLDHNQPRNAVTQESHGFITRDGTSPQEFRRLAHQDLMKYPSIHIQSSKVQDVKSHADVFELMTESGETYHARKTILATGLRETLPAVDRLREYYGKSIFNCSYCDGWELRDQPLIVISDTAAAYHMTMMIEQWTKDLIVCTHGNLVLTEEQVAKLQSKGILMYPQKIQALVGDNGQLQQVVLEDGVILERSGGFVTPQWGQAASIGESLGCELDERGGIVTDLFGRTNIQGVYAAGDSALFAPSQLIIAAAGGSKAAMGVNMDLTGENF
jgi:thioredoxin reductase